MTDPITKRQKTVVVGAGPVGALAALYAAGRGDEVEVYELRGDLRDPSTTPLNFTKSINLALSERGINAMRNAGCPGLLDAVLGETIPMHGRMIHGRNKLGDLYEDSQEYDIHGRFIRAADRGALNKRLLDELDAMPNVTFFFNHKLTGADFRSNRAWFERRNDVSNKNPQADEIEISFDFLIGADGAHSSTRYHLMKYTQMNYTQEYIDTLWCEFQIPPSATNSFRLSPNHLHIWPGQQFMFIAIPSLDRSFTSTLFLPTSIFASLDSAIKSDGPKALLDFFDVHFPGVVPDLISLDALVEQYTRNPHLPLINIKCSPYHYGASAVIVGDAAHAMVPFYGQGMNAGFESVNVLFDLLDKHMPPSPPLSSSPPTSDITTARATALTEYTTHRVPDAHAINALALRNYIEMRASVQSPLYHLRKRIEEALSAYIPALGWSTQYSRVSFGTERYSVVEAKAVRQGRILMGVFGAVLVGFVGGVGLWGWSSGWGFGLRREKKGVHGLMRWLADVVGR
ncbi:MAG: Kynurenine 3-monooxygenase [Sarea resinae]|nr:MAG: Kynurenine 3-monooxygenase [Sarea resinae]